MKSISHTFVFQRQETKIGAAVILSDQNYNELIPKHYLVKIFIEDSNSLKIEI